MMITLGLALTSARAAPAWLSTPHNTVTQMTTAHLFGFE
jgi:hypothetical protein